MVINKAQRLKDKIRSLKLRDKSLDLTYNDVKPALEYIDGYWKNLIRSHPQDESNLIGLPNKFVVPSFQEDAEFDYNEQYYWDSYFIAKGMLGKKYQKLNLGVLDNLIYMYKRFGVIPNASRLYLTSRSHPPLLTSFIWDLYESYGMDEKWLGEKIKVAEEEYNHVWTGTTKPNARKVFKNLSRYYDFNYIHDIAEAESGWDMTPRFNRRCMDYLPVDLNALLYRYERDFKRYYQLIGDDKTADKWSYHARSRKQHMDELMWSKSKNLYFDYNFVKHKKSTVSSLASFVPMWARMVDDDKAAKLVKSLRKFEYDGGLASTDSPPFSKFVPTMSPVPTQWAYPNGWAPLHYFVTEGLLSYGYYQDAKRIAVKWMKSNMLWFNEHHIFLEKYNVVNPKRPPEKGLYPSQIGFGWSNSMFVYFANKYLEH